MSIVGRTFKFHKNAMNHTYFLFEVFAPTICTSLKLPTTHHHRHHMKTVMGITKESLFQMSTWNWLKWNKETKLIMLSSIYIRCSICRNVEAIRWHRIFLMFWWIRHLTYIDFKMITKTFFKKCLTFFKYTNQNKQN